MLKTENKSENNHLTNLLSDHRLK